MGSSLDLSQGTKRQGPGPPTGRPSGHDDPPVWRIRPVASPMIPTRAPLSQRTWIVPRESVNSTVPRPPGSARTDGSPRRRRPAQPGRPPSRLTPLGGFQLGGQIGREVRGAQPANCLLAALRGRSVVGHGRADFPRLQRPGRSGGGLPEVGVSTEPVLDAVSGQVGYGPLGDRRRSQVGCSGMRIPVGVDDLDEPGAAHDRASAPVCWPAVAASVTAGWLVGDLRACFARHSHKSYLTDVRPRP